jgi:hypothetical protein
MALYAVTLFASALLLFLVQPMAGKMILPKLGGTPAVWNTCMVFFQAMLLAGYAYAHGTTAWLSTRRQTVLHLVVLTLPLFVLPISVAEHAAPPSTDSPTGWLLLQLLIGIGVPFFVVSSTAPLLQTWFSRTAHRDAKDPYFLYAASNVGSLLALLGYPLVVEPRLSLDEQSRVWTWGYAILAVLIAACVAELSRSRASLAAIPTAAELDAANDDTKRHSPLTLQSRLWWVLLAAIPSSLMLGVTTFITTDLAAVPLMWVLPLAIYLLTFVFVFAKRAPVPHRLMVKLFPFLVLPMGILFFFAPSRMEWLLVPVHLVMFFVAAMVCHGELVRRRPGPNHLTEFYLLMSVGGVLGGLFNAVIAPQAFTGIFEYPLVMALACLVLPREYGLSSSAEGRRDYAFPVILALVMAAALGILQATGRSGAGWVPPAFFLVLMLTCFTFKSRPVRFGLSYAVMLVTVAVLADLRNGEIMHAERNFFGVKRVVTDHSGRLRLLVHGTTAHGCQMLDPDRSREPSSYYHTAGPIGDMFAAFNASPAGSHVGIIGLGAGAVAAYAQPGQQFTFYEIDPAVERIARDRRYFSYMADCLGACDVVLGDGRLTVAQVPDGQFGLFLLDAFSSDSVPTHLLSREAIEVYLAKLAPGGMLGFHVSNRYFDFEPLLAQVAEELGLACLAKFNQRASAREQADGKLASHCVVMARNPEILQPLSRRPDWRAPVRLQGMQAWTDQYCDVVGLFLAGRQLSLGPRSAIAQPR